jgi:F0F1-type ATP synthase membrane subunit c/vacuolar-type H+-ATPase subunit K
MPTMASQCVIVAWSACICATLAAIGYAITSGLAGIAAARSIGPSVSSALMRTAVKHPASRQPFSSITSPRRASSRRIGGVKSSRSTISASAPLASIAA